MKKYIYYPNLEPPNIEWLKFSLLYLDKFESIVPFDRQHLISDDYRRLLNETDLVEMYSPNPNQGDRASLKTIDEVEKYLKQPYRSSFLFNKINLKRDWKNPDNWNYQLFSEKFSYHWGEYCEEQKIGIRNGQGLLLPKEVAFIFMTHLAKEISYERNGAIITDNIEFDNYSNYSRVHDPRIINRLKFMKGIINLLLPANISEIPLERLVRFRNNNRERIKAFNDQINKIEDSIGNGLTEKDFINSFNDAYSDLVKEILLLGMGVASIPFTSYVLINNHEALSQEYIAEILGALSIGFAGAFSVRKTLFETRERQNFKKYLMNIKRLK